MLRQTWGRMDKGKTECPLPYENWHKHSDTNCIFLAYILIKNEQEENVFQCKFVYQKQLQFPLKLTCMYLYHLLQLKDSSMKH